MEKALKKIVKDDIERSLRFLAFCDEVDQKGYITVDDREKAKAFLEESSYYGPIAAAAANKRVELAKRRVQLVENMAHNLLTDAYNARK